ncbi:MAG: YidC/Oxa1 family insertase periplasmic-domain containing protein, partial [Muribaculaceae bacterium]|nr:YidC/Oxa1 family insertase periplasmic-domain containing protein [Muribaculaceae bacterium]
MDKNTLLGLVMMACVVFGFMWLNKPSEEQLEAQRAEQEQMAEQARIEAEEAARIASQPDSISATERASLIPTIKQIGTTDSVNGTVSFADANVNITIDGQNVSGTVSAAGSSIEINDLLANNFGDLTLAQSKAAVKNLRAALENAGRYSTFARYLSGSENTVGLANDLIAIEFSTLGGRPSRATLLDYDNFLNDDTTNVVMFTPETSTFNFKFVTTQQQRLDTDKFYFTPIVESDSTVLMKLDLGNDAMWGIRYTLRQGSYILGMEVVQKNMESIISPSTATIDFDFGVKMARNEAGRTFEEQKSAIYYKYVGDSPDDLNYSADKTEELSQPVKWIAFKDQFFSTAFISRSSFATAEVHQQVLKNDPMFLKQMNASTVLEYNPTAETPVAFDIFIGPNLYPLLASLDDT